VLSVVEKWKGSGKKDTLDRMTNLNYFIEKNEELQIYKTSKATKHIIFKLIIKISIYGYKYGVNIWLF